MAGFRLADPREYRRGVILGLTLAEVLILLVFLLLLSSGALLARRGREVDGLKLKLSTLETQVGPLARQLKERGVDIRNSDDLVSRLLRLSDDERMRRELADNVSALAAASRKVDELRSEMARVSEDQREVLAKAAAADTMAGLLARAGVVAGAAGRGPAEQLKAVLAQTSTLTAANTELGGQNAQMRTELARMKGNGGSGLPYCWTTPEGRPIYMFQVALHDGDVVVTDLDPKPRPNDPAWSLLDGLPRGRAMSVAELLAATRGLQIASAAAKCRYAINAFDGTSRTNKPGYKYLMGRLWSVFMVREVR